MTSPATSMTPISKNKNAPVLGQMMDYPLTITNILMHARKHPSTRGVTTRTASGKDHHYSYRDLYKSVCQVANALKRLGVEDGDRIGTFAWNTHEHLELYYAIPCLGAIIHTLNIRLSPEQVAYTVNHAGDRIIFVDATLLPLFEKIAPALKSVEKFVIIGGGQMKNGGKGLWL
ncbi:MAG: AMP-binding protein [Bdellovibrionia bacterium]